MSEPCDLAGRGVLVTRPAGQAAGLCRLIEAAGGRPIPFPAVRILPVVDPRRAERVLAEPSDLLIFVSRNAVEYGRLLCPGGRIPAAPLVAAVGRATAEALARVGRAPDLVPEGRYDSESLLALPELQDLRDKSVVIVRGQGGLSLLGDGLVGRGAALTYAEVYRRAPPNADPSALLERWARDVQLVTVTSEEILKNLVGLLGAGGRPLLVGVPLVVISERTRGSALRLGFRRVELADRADDPSIVAALCRCAAKDGRA